MKCNGDFAISVSDSSDVYSDKNNKPGTILSSKMVFMDSPVIKMLQKSKQVQEKFNFKFNIKSSQIRLCVGDLLVSLLFISLIPNQT